MWAIALKTLLSDRQKLLTALLGVAFSVVLVNLQGGLFLGLISKASLLVDHGKADIWVGHSQMHNVDFTKDIPRRWIHRIRGIPGVQAAEPYLIGGSIMTLPNGGFETVIVVGSEKRTLMGSARNLRDGSIAAIRRHDGVMVDIYDAEKLQSPRLGELREIGGHQVRIVARSQGILGFLVTPYVFTTFELAREILNKSPESCSYVLVNTDGNVEPQQLCDQIRRRLPEAGAYMKAEYARMSVSYWMRRTGLGISFGAATVLGLVIGLTVVAQTLYASVLDRLSDFGALKAIGASDGKIYAFLFAQALTMAMAGSLIGLGAAFAIQVVWSTPRAPILIPWYLSLGSCLVVVGICLLSAALPYLRIRRIDPAMVLQM